MKALFLSPHTDDCEEGCGGTIAKFVEEGAEVFHIAFSPAIKSIPPGFPKDSTLNEFFEASMKLGIKKDNSIVLNYEVRKFPQFRQEILEEIVKLKRDIKPDIVFLPSTHDIHQDHEVISREGIRGCRESSILGYEMLRNNLVTVGSCFFRISQNQLSKKLEALGCYKSQLVKRNIIETIENLAKINGTLISVNLAERFEVIRWIV